jgi:type I restriction enzyme M protein
LHGGAAGAIVLLDTNSGLLWFLTRNKNDGKSRNRTGETLFIDARKMGTLVDRVHRDFSEEDITKIADTYHAWKSGMKYENMAGYCASVTLKETQEQGYVLTPGRYVGAAEIEDDDEPFKNKMARLTNELEAQFEESDRLEKQILVNLRRVDG